MAYSKEEKAEYDRAYRARNAEMLKRKKAAYYQRTHDPGKEAIKRKQRMPNHLAYCRTDEYRAYKKAFDRKKREEEYGEFSECWLLLLDLVAEIKRKQPDRNERYRESQRYQWNPAVQRRRRADAKARREAGIDSLKP